MLRQITILGTGLIGGSLALAAKREGIRVIGSDRPSILDEAKRRGVIDTAVADPVAASKGSDVVVLAMPVGAILELMEKLAPALSPGTLLTDVGSTKSAIVARAYELFGDAAASRFLPGHPMAGKEHSGVENADADLFRDAVWLVTPLEVQTLDFGRAGDYTAFLAKIGARVIAMDAERHDRVCAWVSHLPQMLSTALAGTLLDEFTASGPEGATLDDVHAVGGRALREMTRIASSPYSMWRDIALTNSENIADALLALEQRLAHLRENLRSPELRREFEQGNRFHDEKPQARNQKQK
ncbi:MAG TPA: prephenate dehydrogenase/arogenate dehydrogenase family protein [Terriglobales bacterium]|nr:prephenate dehydrogenase/arogenate dehydrogenase family protein [Terriglobales bacterium]